VDDLGQLSLGTACPCLKELEADINELPETDEDLCSMFPPSLTRLTLAFNEQSIDDTTAALFVRGLSGLTGLQELVFQSPAYVDYMDYSDCLGTYLTGQGLAAFTQLTGLTRLAVEDAQCMEPRVLQFVSQVGALGMDTAAAQHADALADGPARAHGHLLLQLMGCRMT